MKKCPKCGFDLEQESKRIEEEKFKEIFSLVCKRDFEGIKKLAKSIPKIGFDVKKEDLDKIEKMVKDSQLKK